MNRGQKIFLVGMPRSGTTSLMKLLNSHENIVSFGESLFWGRGYLHPINGIYYSKKQIDYLIDFYSTYNWINDFSTEQKRTFEQELTNGFKKLYLDGKATPKLFFNFLCNVFKTTFKKNISIEKTPHHIHNIDRIKSHYPDAKFLISYRNPYDFILSYKYQGSQNNIKNRKKFKRTYHPLQVSLICRKYLNSIKKYKNSNSVLILDIISLTEGNGIKDLASFLNVNFDNFGVYTKDNSSFSKMNIKPKLNAVDYFWANLILGKYIKENDEFRNSNCDLLTICKSVLKIPLSLFYNIYYLDVAKGQTKLKYLFSYLKK